MKMMSSNLVTLIEKLIYDLTHCIFYSLEFVNAKGHFCIGLDASITTQFKLSSNYTIIQSNGYTVKIAFSWSCSTDNLMQLLLQESNVFATPLIPLLLTP